MKSQLKFRHLFLQGWGQRIKPYEIVDGVGKKSADQGIYNPGSAELLLPKGYSFFNFYFSLDFKL